MLSPSPIGSPLFRRLRRSSGALAPRSVLLRKVRTRRPLVALTFDDGPDDETPLLLDLLDTLGALGTFFVVGHEAARRPELIEEMLARGHDVVSHGWSHRRIVNMSPTELTADLARTRAALPPSPGRPLFRPPHGEISALSLFCVAALGYTTVLWSIDSLDSRPIAPQAIVEQLTRSAPSSGDIVLLHEGEVRTREALPEIVDLLSRRGLTAMPLSHLLEFT